MRTAFSPAAEARALPSTGLAALEPLSCAARPRKLRCLFDNGQWLDEAALKPLTFLARRVGCEPGAMVFDARPQQVAGKTGELSNLSDQPGQFAGGPSESDAQALLAANSHVMSDDPVRWRLAAEARGNSRALLGPPESAGMPRRHILRANPDRARSRIRAVPAAPLSSPFRCLSARSLKMRYLGRITTALLSVLLITMGVTAPAEAHPDDLAGLNFATWNLDKAGCSWEPYPPLTFGDQCSLTAIPSGANFTFEIPEGEEPVL
ncbi:hypothetical protein [Streptomyces sp. NPDC002853]